MFIAGGQSIDWRVNGAGGPQERSQGADAIWLMYSGSKGLNHRLLQGCTGDDKSLSSSELQPTCYTQLTSWKKNQPCHLVVMCVCVRAPHTNGFNSHTWYLNKCRRAMWVTISFHLLVVLPGSSSNSSWICWCREKLFVGIHFWQACFRTCGAIVGGNQGKVFHLQPIIIMCTVGKY